MRGWELVRWLGLFLCLATLAVWIVHGGHIFTKDKQMVVHREYDPLFGVTRERIEWQPGFRLGLDIAAPVAIGGLGVWLVGWWLRRRKKFHNQADLMGHSTQLALLLSLSAVALASAATSFPLPVKGPQTVTLTNRVGQNLCRFLSSAPLEEFEGTADGISGSFVLNPQNLEATTGQIRVSVASMRTGITRRDEHLRSPEWLDAERYPSISFEIRGLTDVRITEQSSERATLTAKAVGVFSLHGVDKPMELPITLTYLLENAETRKRAPGDLVLVQSEFTISLRDFNIRGRQGVIGSRVGEVIRVWVTLYGSTAGQSNSSRGER